MFLTFKDFKQAISCGVFLVLPRYCNKSVGIITRKAMQILQVSQCSRFILGIIFVYTSIGRYIPRNCY